MRRTVVLAVLGGLLAVPGATARTQDTRRYAAFFHAMLDNGVYLPPSAFEAWFVGAAHDGRALDRVAAAAKKAANAAADVRTAP